MFVLFYIIFWFAAIVIDSVIIVLLELKQPLLACTGIYYVAMILPTLALTIRRLHDTGRSGWWIFITMIPLVGGIMPFGFMFAAPIIIKTTNNTLS
jgi:uncharacterized membrane protein YhaH (DUF805 family)